MFLFNPSAAPKQNLAEALREEEHQEVATRLFTSGYQKRVNRSNRVKIVDGVAWQQCGGGRRRLSTRADY